MTTRKTIICPSEGSIFDCKAQALVNPVNCVGVAGAGLAKEFKEKFPENFKEWAEKCKRDSAKVGTLLVYKTGKKQPKYIVNFPTKKDWRDPSELSYIRSGLLSLVEWIDVLKLKSIAVPALGCGRGNLDWNDVRPAIMRAFLNTRNLKVYLFAPQ